MKCTWLLFSSIGAEHYSEQAIMQLLHNCMEKSNFCSCAFC
uniref:Uncharacterized protein n=1 Tax=Anguilla anguilla TaxID=7936 RepID=A0A0E9W681_ANGAN